MPRYRVPFDLYERAARYAAAAKPRTKVEELVLELAQARGMEGLKPLFAGTWIHMNFGSRGNREASPPCSVCGWISERQCDRIVNHDILVHGEPRRCDRWLCSGCTYEPAPGKDLCPQCVLLFKAWLAGRTNTTDGDG